MPRLPDVDQATYVCPKCKQAVQKTREDFGTPELRKMFNGRMPAYLLCGRCYSEHPNLPTKHMWRTDVPQINRKVSLWGAYGSSAPSTHKRTSDPFQRIRDVSFARCKRFVAYVITERVITNTGDLLEAAANEVVDVKTAKGKLNACAVHFSTSKEKAIRGQHYAVIDWAPNGKWGDADTVRTGYYKDHQFKIIRQHLTKKQG